MKDVKETGGKFNFVSWDKRVMQRNLRRHLLSLSDCQKHQKGLPDDSGQSEEAKVFKDLEVSPIS